MSPNKSRATFSSHTHTGVPRMSSGSFLPVLFASHRFKFVLCRFYLEHTRCPGFMFTSLNGHFIGLTLCTRYLTSDSIWGPQTFLYQFYDWFSSLSPRARMVFRTFFYQALLALFFLDIELQTWCLMPPKGKNTRGSSLAIVLARSVTISCQQSSWTP